MRRRRHWRITLALVLVLTAAACDSGPGVDDVVPTSRPATEGRSNVLTDTSTATTPRPSDSTDGTSP